MELRNNNLQTSTQMQQPFAMATIPDIHYVSPGSASNSNTATVGSVASTKRYRDDSDASCGSLVSATSTILCRTVPPAPFVHAQAQQLQSLRQQLPPRQAQQPSQPVSKKSRENTYIAPRKVPKSLISSMGSLAGGPGLMRRQLSGSNIDPYLGDHDSMDVESAADSSRPRSMSF
jgi:hypothetical protein